MTSSVASPGANVKLSAKIGWRRPSKIASYRGSNEISPPHAQPPHASKVALMFDGSLNVAACDPAFPSAPSLSGVNTSLADSGIALWMS